MFVGWSPTGTLVNPGRSTSVKLRTSVEYIFKCIGCLEMPFAEPAIRSLRRERIEAT